jgi:hypothetical protein
MTSNERMADLPGTPEAPVWQPPVEDDEPDGATPTAAAAADTAEAAEMAPAEAAPTEIPTGLHEAPPVERIQRRSTSRPPARRSGSTTAMLMLSALVALGGIGFAVGRATSNGSTGNQTSNGAAAGNFGADGSFEPGQFRPGTSGAPDFRGVAGSTTVTGTVESVSADSMTVRLADGQTVTIALGSSTTYHGQTSATSSQVTTGSTVVVQTTAGSTSASASASPGTGSTNRTATDVTITSN